jgi:hypothetical protein
MERHRILAAVAGAGQYERRGLPCEPHTKMSKLDSREHGALRQQHASASDAAARHAAEGTDRSNRAVAAAGRRPFCFRATEPSIAHRLAIAALLSATLTACSAPEPVPVTPPGERAGAAVVRKPLVAPASSANEATAATEVAASAPRITVPAGSQYVCVTVSSGVPSQTTIAFAPKVAQLCLRHPEMGPCQYERNLCRRSGGRVYAAGGEEITMATEAEYDKHVLRVRFKSN